MSFVLFYDMERFEQRVSEVGALTRAEIEESEEKKKKKKSTLKMLGEWMKPRSKSGKAAQSPKSMEKSRRTDSSLPTSTRTETDMAYRTTKNDYGANAVSASHGQYSEETAEQPRLRRQMRRRMSM